jgi:uncharacterized membrane protein
VSSATSTEKTTQSRSLTVNDVKMGSSSVWISKGLNDLKSNPLPSILYGLMFTLAGILMIWMGPSNALFTIILLSAFMLVGPLAAVGLYDMSRRVEKGESSSLLHAMSIIRFHPFKLLGFALILGGILLVWMYITSLIVKDFFGSSPLVTQGWEMILNGQDSLSFIAVFILAGFILALIATIVSVMSIPMASHKRKDTITAAVIVAVLLVVWARLMSFFYGLFFNQTELINAGWGSLLGNENFLPFVTTFVISGFLLAVVVFSISVVTVPLLFHRNTSIMTAIATSVRVVMVNPATMMRWSATIAFLIIVGMGLFFIGLAVTLPLIGHASWHAYRDLIAE